MESNEEEVFLIPIHKFQKKSDFYSFELILEGNIRKLYINLPMLAIVSKYFMKVFSYSDCDQYKNKKDEKLEIKKLDRNVNENLYDILCIVLKIQFSNYKFTINDIILAFPYIKIFGMLLSEKKIKEFLINGANLANLAFSIHHKLVDVIDDIKNKLGPSFIFDNIWKEEKLNIVISDIILSNQCNIDYNLSNLIEIKNIMNLNELNFIALQQILLEIFAIRSQVEEIKNITIKLKEILNNKKVIKHDINIGISFDNLKVINTYLQKKFIIFIKYVGFESFCDICNHNANFGFCCNLMNIDDIQKIPHGNFDADIHNIYLKNIKPHCIDCFKQVLLNLILPKTLFYNKYLIEETKLIEKSNNLKLKIELENINKDLAIL